MYIKNVKFNQSGHLENLSNNWLMNEEKLKQKQRTKQLLLQKLKKIKVKSDNVPTVVPIASSAPQPVPPEQLQERKQKDMKIITSFGNSNKQILDNQLDIMEEKSNRMMEDDGGRDDMNNKDSKKNLRVKRPYYEHYSKQGVFQPILQYVRNHPNPSGKPPNIPQQLYQGIEVVPKRPWVYFGPENIPPSDCQQINEKTFSVIFDQAKKLKGTGAFKKSNKKKGFRRNEDQISEVSDEFTSNFTFSDSVDMSKESDLISQFRSQTRTLKVYDSSGNVQESYMDDEFSSISGSVTQRQRYNLFDSSESEEEKQQQSSMEASRRRKKFKKLLQSSDDEPEKSSMNKVSSHQNSSGAVNAGSSANAPNSSDKGSSNKVEVDDGESSVSRSKSRSMRAENNEKAVPKVSQRPKRSARIRKMKEQQDDDSI